MNKQVFPVNSIEVEPIKHWVIEVDASKASLYMALKQALLELFKPLVVSILSYVLKKKTGVLKITNKEKYNDAQRT